MREFHLIYHHRFGPYRKPFNSNPIWIVNNFHKYRKCAHARAHSHSNTFNCHFIQLIVVTVRYFAQIKAIFHLFLLRFSCSLTISMLILFSFEADFLLSFYGKSGMRPHFSFFSRTLKLVMELLTGDPDCNSSWSNTFITIFNIDGAIEFVIDGKCLARKTRQQKKMALSF